MRTRSSVWLAGITAAALVGVLAWDNVRGVEGAADSGDDAAIRKVVDLYYHGVAEADRPSLELAWDVVAGDMKHVRHASNVDAVTVTPISTAIEWWTRVKAKKSSLKVLSVDAVDGKMATVKLQFVYDKWDYTEFLTLFKLSGSWKIVNKTYVKKLAKP